MNREPRYFTKKEFNRICFEAAHAMIKFSKERKQIDKPFQKQIMLAVSEVNKCSVCSHVHTKALIKSGASDEELKSLLEGTFDKLGDDVSLALIFATHYADERGKYDKEAFVELVNHYGKEKALGIMATIKIIMFGNTNGISLTNLSRRVCFKRNKNSKFLTEIYNGLFAYLLLPLFLLINLFVRKKKYI